MNPTSFQRKTLTAIAGLLILAGGAQSAPTTMTASELAAKLNSLGEEGSSEVRMLMKIQTPSEPEKTALQIQIKERRSESAVDVAYRILWPKNRAGEAVLIHQKTGRAPTGSVIGPDGKQTGTSNTSQSIFGSHLSMADAVENFYAWKNQSLGGTATIDGVKCQILESKPRPEDFSIYGHVRSWVDLRRMVPLLIEKYLPSGKVARKISTTRVVSQGDNLPSSMSIQQPGEPGLTELEGSKLKRAAVFTDRDFTPEGIAP